MGRIRRMGNEVTTEEVKAEQAEMLDAIAVFRRPDGLFEVETVRGPSVEALQTYMWNYLGPMHRGCIGMELYILAGPGTRWPDMPPAAKYPAWEEVLKRLDEIEAKLAEGGGQDGKIIDFQKKLQKLFND